MSTRLVGLLLLAVSGGFLLLSGALWVKAAAGSAFILGFLVFALDLMRRSIEKRS